jgi:hypothetical protein
MKIANAPAAAGLSRPAVRGWGMWILRVMGGAALAAGLMAPGCPWKQVPNFFQPILRALAGVDPAAQNMPPVPSVPYNAVLVRQSDCSVTRLVFDAKKALLSSYPNYQDFVHQALGLSSTADQFKSGCQDPTTGIASQLGVFLGKIATGANAGNYEFATLTGTGLQITVAKPDYSIVSTSSYPIASVSNAPLAMADLNADGIPDIVVASGSLNPANGTLTVLLGKSDGTFQAPQTISLPFTPVGVTLDDLNGDGKLDIVATTVLGTGPHLAVLLGHGDGSFAAPLLDTSGATGAAVVTGDFNSDGKKDVATSDGYILLGNGDGTFSAPFAPQFASAGGIASGDFNHDGKLDLALTSGIGTVDIYLGQGDGHFSHTASYATLFGAGSISTTDLDGDGSVDLFIGAHSGGCLPLTSIRRESFRVYWGAGTARSPVRLRLP